MSLDKLILRGIEVVNYFRLVDFEEANSNKVSQFSVRKYKYKEYICEEFWLGRSSEISSSFFPGIISPIRSLVP